MQENFNEYSIDRLLLNRHLIRDDKRRAYLENLTHRLVDCSLPKLELIVLVSLKMVPFLPHHYHHLKKAQTIEYKFFLSIYSHSKRGPKTHTNAKKISFDWRTQRKGNENAHVRCIQFTHTHVYVIYIMQSYTVTSARTGRTLWRVNINQIAKKSNTNDKRRKKNGNEKSQMQTVFFSCRCSFFSFFFFGIACTIFRFPFHS